MADKLAAIGIRTGLFHQKMAAIGILDLSIIQISPVMETFNQYSSCMPRLSYS